MTTQPCDHTITEMLQTVAELITSNAKGDRPSWVMFLLTEIQSITPAQSYADQLERLQEGIAGQLAEMASWPAITRAYWAGAKIIWPELLLK